MEQIVAIFEDFYYDVAAATSRMNEKPFSGCLHAFEKLTEAELLANRLCKGFQYCLDKSWHATKA